MKIKKEMTKPLSILLLIITLFSFPSYAEEPATQQETSISQDKDIEDMDIGELLEEIKNLDKEDIKKIKDIFSYSHFFGFGPRHSVGKNSFKLISIEEIKRKPNLNNKLLLSQSVFDECINLSESNYQIISKQYHPSKT